MKMTQVVNGLVYSPEHKGFLYHTWAESLADLTPLVEWVGSTRIKVLEAR